MPASHVTKFPNMPEIRTVRRYYKKWVSEIAKAETQDIVERQREVQIQTTSAIANQIDFLTRQQNNMQIEEGALLEEAKKNEQIHDEQPYLDLSKSRYTHKINISKAIMEGLVLLAEVQMKVTIDEEVKSKVREWIADETHKAAFR